jgi:hypothetical protein
MKELNKTEYVEKTQEDYIKNLFEGFQEKISKRDIGSIYRIRDSLISRVNAELIEKKCLEKFLQDEKNSAEAGLVSTVLYLTADNFKDMAKATDLAFKQRYGFMAVTGEINEIHELNQTMFADVDYTEKNSSGFQYATRINELVDSSGHTAMKLNGKVGKGIGLYENVLANAEGEIGLLENCRGSVARDFNGKVGKGIGLYGGVLANAEGEIGLLEKCSDIVARDFNGKVGKGIELYGSVLRYAEGEIGLLENCGNYVGGKAKIKYIDSKDWKGRLESLIHRIFI